MTRLALFSSAATVVGLTLCASGVNAQTWDTFGGTYDCVGRSIGNGVVKLNCSQEQTRGTRIYTLTPSFTIRGPIAQRYLGNHKDCRQVAASESTSNQPFVDCPGISKWW
jgi:hypothetical protein